MKTTTPYRYEPNWTENAALRDGTPVELRLVRPDDKRVLLAGFVRLSHESRLRRFLTDKADLTQAELRFLTEADGVDHVALGAVTYDELERPQAVGIARFVRLPGSPDVAEPAITVVDAMQGKGAGTLLLRHLVAAAQERGITRFRAEMLASNEPMRALIDFLAPVHKEVREDGDVLICEFELPPAGEPAAAAERPAIYRILALVAQGLLLVRRAVDAVIPGATEEKEKEPAGRG